MIPLAEAFALLDQVVAALALPLASELIALPSGLKRVLALPQLSSLDLPPFNKSAMDGYAIAAVDWESKRADYSVGATVAAGCGVCQVLSSGVAVKVMTGAPVPAGTAVVVPIEMVNEREASAKKIAILHWPAARNISLCGEDVKSGDLIAAGGTTITPVLMANLVACGITTVPVYRKVRVAIITTGDEIVDDIAAMGEGKIMDSNGPMLQALCEEQGVEVVVRVKVSDDYHATTRVIAHSLEQADIVLISGGVSAGDFDFVAPALTAAGLQINFNRVAIKPGKPTTFASAEGKLAFGLPGNPLAVYLTFYLFVVRALRGLFNCALVAKGMAAKIERRLDDEIKLPLAQSFKRRQSERTEYVLCRLQPDGRLMPVASHGSAHLAALLQSDGFFVVAQGVAAIGEGERVTFFSTQRLNY